VWVAVGLSALGILAALLTGGRRSGAELKPVASRKRPRDPRMTTA
jgi:hypothetical protein